MPVWLISLGRSVAKFFSAIWDFYWKRLTLKAKLALWTMILLLIVIGYAIEQIILSIKVLE